MAPAEPKETGKGRGGATMYLDVIDLRDFYATLLGRTVLRLVDAAIGRLAEPAPKGAVLGFGFATPYLPRLAGGAERVIGFMPAQQGVLDWPPEGRSATALVEEAALPLPDASMDFILVVHALEMSPKPHALTGELRRVLTAGGRLLIVVPNRQGLWARSDISPFGHGRPYSRGQLRALFAEAGFQGVAWDTALYMPPSGRRTIIRSSGMLERTGRRFWPAFCGVTLALAIKTTIEGVRVRVRPRLAPALGHALQPRALGRSSAREHEHGLFAEEVPHP